MKTLLAILFLIGSFTSLFAQAELVKDIFTGFDNTTSSAPQNLIDINGVVYYSAFTDYGRELWKSDGTSAGTVLVKDINAGENASNPTELTNVNGTLFFSANDGVNGDMLWKSDGTASGTVIVGTGFFAPQYLTNVNGTLFFNANNGINGVELWKSDGTNAGTVVVKDIVSGSGGAYPQSLTNVNGTLFFRADDVTNGAELWKSDGTSAGTVLVKDINAGANSSTLFHLTNINGTLFFSANNGINGSELWKSDGTTAGTVLVKDINTGLNDGNLDYLTNVNGTLFFNANNGVNGNELWKSDGTVVGTVLVKDIEVGASGGQPAHLTNVNGILFFRAYQATLAYELWKSDGTAAGTVLVKDINSGANFGDPLFLTNVNGTLFFRANDGINGAELWKSDGTTAGTVLIKDITVGANTSSPNYFTSVNGTLFFSASDGVNGNELWKSDGTTAGTVLVKDICTIAFNGDPQSLTNVNGTLFFSASSGSNGNELWKSDGTTAGTVLVKDITVGVNSSSPNYLTNLNGTLFFSANNGINGSELWKSDGTTAGTVLVKDISPGANSGSPEYLTNVNGTLFFIANDGVNGTELWKSDGTAAGTILVKVIYAGANYGFAVDLINVNGLLFFVANNGVTGYELWKSDGTTAGTVLIKDIYAGSVGSTPQELTNMNGTLFFRANDVINGVELWKSDGTTAGTVLVKDIYTGANHSYPQSFTNLNGTLFFRANDVINGSELWKSDGTTAGTVLVKDINVGSISSSPNSITNVNGTLFFSANFSGNGTELWKSDGTATGTILVKDIYTGANPSFPNSLTNVNDTLYFSADDGINGMELWKSDGTSCGTYRVTNINQNSLSSSPYYFQEMGGVLYFSALETNTGRELWKYTSEPMVIYASTSSLTACDAYTWSANGTTYLTGGVYTAVLTNMNGCDSTATLNLTINNSNAGSESVTECDTYTWSTNGTTYATGGVYTAVLTNMYGCDSIVTLNLTINNSNAGSETITACNAYTWSANGMNYTSSGMYTAVLTNMNGCDSTATLNLTINNSNAGSQNVTACNAYTWIANGTTYTTGGIYTALLTNMYGCDSTATLNLTINNSNAGSQNVTACNSYLWTANGTNYTTGGTYTAILTNMNGCDSTATLNLTINNSNAGSQNVTACNAYTWIANGTTYTTGGTYTALLTNMNGCDSTATLNLTIHNSNAGSQNVTACNSYTWSANGTNYTTGGTYTALLTNMNGCDSTATLNLTINNSNSGSQNVTACNSYLWTANGTNYTTGGTYTAILTNMNGCDSTATLNLTINNSNAGSQNVTACNSYLWTANGTTYSTGGTYTALLTNMNGCDSTATLNLTIYNSNAGSQNVTACNSYTWSANGTNYTTGGTYTALLTNMNGCDSTATLNLTIHNSNSGSQNVTACNSYLWTANGTTYTTGGIYTALLTNMYGCDSTATLNLTIHNSNSGSETITSCDSYFWSANGTTYTAGGIYAVVLTNMNGCDSTATLNLTINTVDNSINTIGDISLEANTSSAQYQWLDCDDSYSAILNETNQLFVASSNGNYAVEVSENGCVDTSACLLIYSVGMNEINTASVLIYPNPTFDFVTVQVGANTVHTIQLLDTWGRIVKIVNVNSNEVELDLQKMERGVYYLKLIADNSTMIEKVVKE